MDNFKVIHGLIVISNSKLFDGINIGLGLQQDIDGKILVRMAFQGSVNDKLYDSFKSACNEEGILNMINIEYENVFDESTNPGYNTPWIGLDITKRGVVVDAGN